MFANSRTLSSAAYHDRTSEITPEDVGLVPYNHLASHSGSFYEKIEAFGQRLIEDALRLSDYLTGVRMEHVDVSKAYRVD